MGRDAAKRRASGRPKATARATAPRRAAARAATVKKVQARDLAEPRVRLETDERRAQLVELGLEHFGTRAYDDVSIDVLARAAGISKGLLYHYFPTKRAFYTACVREAAARVLAFTETPSDLPPIERIDRGIAAYLEYVNAHGPAYAALMRSGVGVDPEIATIIDQTRETFVARIVEGISSALTALPPLTRIALRGWVGFAEDATLAWVEEGARVPAHEIRDLLKRALFALLPPDARS